MRTQKLLAVAAALAAAGSALAITELQIDINALRAQAYHDNNTKGFGGVNHTGRIQLMSSGITNLADILIDGAAQGIAAGMLSSVAGQIDLVGGFVTGGFLEINLMNGDTFTADISSADGQIQFQAGQGFSIDGLITNAVFSGPTFAGIDVSLWYDVQPLEGSFIEFAFGPNVMGFDSDTNLDIFLPTEEDDTPVIPAPLAGVMGGVSLLGLGARRRR